MKEKHPIVKAIARLIFLFGRIILSVRYKVRLERIEDIDHKRPVLFLPNHQAVVDPMILVSFLYPHKNIVPMITSTYYDLPIAKLFFKNWGAVRISDLEKGSRNTNVLNEITESAIKAFKYQKSIVIYPSGQITSQGFEKIQNKKGAFEIVRNLPSNVQVVGVRISGLWGSQWSKAWNGQSPNFGVNILKGLFYTLANILFFMPKRKVSLYFEDISDEALKFSSGDKQRFNLFLENFYNAKGEEPVSFLKHYFYSTALKRNLPENLKPTEASLKKTIPLNDSFPKAIIKEVNHIIKKHLQVQSDQINKQSHLINDLGADSINIVEIIKDIEAHFKVETQNDLSDIKRVVHLYQLANGDLQSKTILPPCSFPKNNLFHDYIKVQSVDNIPKLFLKRFTKNRNLPFSYDSMLGETNRKDFFLKVCVISEIIKKNCKDEYIGIMLPALQSTSLLIMATYFAGKVPVMLNWTVGQSILDHCIKKSGVKHIFSASSFIKKIDEQLSGNAKDKLIFLDKDIQRTSFYIKLKGAFKSKLPEYFFRFDNIKQTAVILFTSGSENLPKTVKLTHKNIIYDLKGTLELLDLERNRVLMAFLPPFHSFGFTVLSILPLITGTRTVYSPDPTDGRTLVRIIKHTGASILVTTPGFYKNILNNAISEDLAHIKYIVSGGESLSQELTNYSKSIIPQAYLLEGYGITECSPVLSLNPLQKQKKGSVGKIINGVECKIIDLESNLPLDHHKTGMICVKGKSIFNGYNDPNIASPFIKIDHEIFYKTGDLGYLDHENYLFITGRLKRFIKISGEMVSLPFIENLLEEHFGDHNEKILAVEGNDKVEPPQIVLFTKKPITQNEANEYLRLKKAPLIAKITRIELIEKIPLLGTGKVDYKILKDRC